jgi:lipopolysaccharide transport system permease protein
LLFFLAWRDIKVRYKQTLLGVAWAVLQPTLIMIVFTVFLGTLAGLSSGDFPYPIFVYAGLLPWTFFATALANAGKSVVASEQLITKVYFPRLIIAFSAVGAALVDFAMAFLVLFGLMLFYGIAPTLSFLLLPLLVVLATLAALGVGTLVAALNVSYRDFRYLSVLPRLPLPDLLFASTMDFCQAVDLHAGHRAGPGNRRGPGRPAARFGGAVRRTSAAAGLGQPVAGT